MLSRRVASAWAAWARSSEPSVRPHVPVFPCQEATYKLVAVSNVRTVSSQTRALIFLILVVMLLLRHCAPTAIRRRGSLPLLLSGPYYWCCSERTCALLLSCSWCRCLCCCCSPISHAFSRPRFCCCSPISSVKTHTLLLSLCRCQFPPRAAPSALVRSCSRSLAAGAIGAALLYRQSCDLTPTLLLLLSHLISQDSYPLALTLPLPVPSSCCS